MSSRSDAPDSRLRNRVRGFLDMIQDSTGKKAHKACADLAAEFPNAHLAKAALSVAYLRLGQIKQSVQLVEEAAKKVPEWLNDSPVVHYYMAAIKSLERMDLLEAIWEKAVAMDKKSASNHENLFAICLRTANSAKQISSATDLWRLTGDMKYLMWSIVARAQPVLRPDSPRAASIAHACFPSTYTFVHSPAYAQPNFVLNELEAKDKLILQLANTMFQTKFLQPGLVTKHLDLDFILRVLINLGDFNQALELLRSPIAKKLYGISAQRLSEEAALLLVMKHYPEAQQAYETLLQEHNADEWSWYLGYFESLFGPLPLADVDAAKIVAASSFLKSLQAKGENGVKLRGPYLAEMELESLTSSKKFNAQLLVSYFALFSSKPSCYRDIMAYIKYVSPESYGSLLEALKANVVLDPTQLTAETSLGVFATICTYKGLVRCIRAPTFSATERKQEIGELWSLYNAARKADHPREATERFCADELLLMIAYYHCDSFAEESKTFVATDAHTVQIHHFPIDLAASPLKHLIQAACALEYGVAHSKFNFQFRLLLTEVYEALGSVRSLVDQFDGADVKQIQLDSVGFLFLDPLFRYGSMTDMTKIMKRTSLFYDEARRSTLDWAFAAYQKGAYHKVKETTTFAEKLNHSVHRHASRLEQLFLSVAESSTVAASLPSINVFVVQQKLPNTLEACTKLYRNHDGEALDWWAFEVPAFKHIEVPSGLVRSSCYPDQYQSFRVLADVSLTEALQIVSEYQPTEKAVTIPTTPFGTRLEPTLTQLEAALAGFTPEHFERLTWSIVRDVVKLCVLMHPLGAALTSENPDAEGVQKVHETSESITHTLQEILKIYSSASEKMLISTTNAPLITPVLTRVLPLIILCHPLLIKLIPARPKPKTPEDVRTQTSTVRAALRLIPESIRAFLTQMEQILQAEATATNNFALDHAKVFGETVSEEFAIVSVKLSQRVLDALTYSRKDTHQTLLGFINHKIREFKQL